MSSGLSSQELSESIIVLGKGRLNLSRRYEELTYCLAGIGETSGWVRLYPLLHEQRIRVFDVVQAIIRDYRPESHRPESWKVDPGCVIVTGREGDPAERRAILESMVEPGDFLHGEEWRHKSLGLVKPIGCQFKLEGQKARVSYRCGALRCWGHTNEVFDVMLLTKPDALRRMKWLELLRSGRIKGSWFVMGTLSNRPQKWMLITAHFDVG